MEPSYQVLYGRPCSPLYFFISIILLILASVCVHCVYISRLHFPNVSNTLGAIFGLLLGTAMGLCMLAIMWDPAICWTTKKRVNNGDGERAIRVKRPIVGFRHLEIQLETPGELDDVWFDGVKHRKAIFLA
ncbi:uncharacterized protein ASPGLDRAFT_35277 [Aspergillus glaucus CBS 516.65]|uniref:Uncharacterized protein n=1 Tax=Aspergillus glaucus CBS 516.65 TaxID=1160497 RepID=A0A1L9VLR7_ASPGL|nr:hypothetical protein ASPGLDRAFT_35277 [Aspergillus glaucus CBS 516.65]OJJ84820.1 hypothetical protein ASPGLDRAFT_35277 [Aspergillus glaucus CBS 516.65]